MQTTRNYFLVMFTKWEVPLRMEKGQCGWLLFSKKKKKRNKYRTIAPFLYCLFQAKYFKGNYMTVRLDCLFFLKKKKKTTLWPLSVDGVQLSQGQSHFEEAVYFLSLSSQKFRVLILSTLEG